MKKSETPECDHCETLGKSLFCHLGKESLGNLDAHKTSNLYKKGQVIFHEGNRPLGVYCLERGKVKIYKTGIDGREQIVRLAGPGELIGYRAFLGEEFYSASAASIEDSQICFIDRDDFNHVLKENNTISTDLIRNLSHELREAEDMLQHMAQKSVRERLAETILLIKKKYGTEKNNAAALNVHFSREELASFVGTATETLIRLLSDLKAEKVIDTEGKKIIILNEAKLLTIANLEH